MKTVEEWAEFLRSASSVRWRIIAAEHFSDEFDIMRERGTWTEQDRGYFKALYRAASLLSFRREVVEEMNEWACEQDQLYDMTKEDHSRIPWRDFVKSLTDNAWDYRGWSGAHKKRGHPSDIDYLWTVAGVVHFLPLWGDLKNYRFLFFEHKPFGNGLPPGQYHLFENLIRIGNNPKRVDGGHFILCVTQSELPHQPTEGRSAFSGQGCKAVFFTPESPFRANLKVWHDEREFVRECIKHLGAEFDEGWYP